MSSLLTRRPFLRFVTALCAAPAAFLPGSTHAAPVARGGQPMPRFALWMDMGGADHTVLVRRWESIADTRRCRLCPACTALDDVCALVLKEAPPAGREKLYAIGPHDPAWNMGSPEILPSRG